jgi:hypothetical protein
VHTLYRMIRVLSCICCVVMLWSVVVTAKVRAEGAQQSNVSPTPASIVLPSPLPLTTQSIATPTPTYTPSPLAPVLLEALTEANVRAEPDPESELLGTIRAGDVYAVIGRYFRWYQFRFEETPRGTGWVFDELVTITGDESEILDLSENAVPTADGTSVAATNVALEITQTPGGILTATAAAVVIPLPVETNGSANNVLNTDLANGLTVLPTFTYPPEIAPLPPENAFQVGADLDATPTLVPDGLIFSNTDGVPPILPILLLGAAGILGLAITSFRR